MNRGPRRLRIDRLELRTEGLTSQQAEALVEALGPALQRAFATPHGAPPTHWASATVGGFDRSSATRDAARVPAANPQDSAALAGAVAVRVAAPFGRFPGD